MKKYSTVIASALLVMLLSPITAFSQDPPKIYGSQLMTEQERIEHRQRIRNAKTEAERKQIRQEHHKRMQERAKKQGVTLPDAPPPRGKGKGQGAGMGQGQGQGQGQGMMRGK